MTDLPSAPATDRNREAILEVLLDEFGDRQAVLEIGSGTGQHAIYFSDNLRQLTWQTSDRTENHAGILSWIKHAAVKNVLPPLDLDVEERSIVAGNFDAVFSANTSHIMGMPAVERMFALVGQLLPEDGKFCLYGPFNRNGEFTSKSNERFDASLRSQNPQMGIRDLEILEKLAEKSGLQRISLYTMPANNFMVVWRRLQK